MSLISEELVRDKRVLCIADTPFQVLALMCLFSDPHNRTFSKCDIAVVPKFDFAEELCVRLHSTRLFDSTHCAERNPYLQMERHLALRLIREMYDSNSHAKARFFGAFPRLAGRQYDTLAISGPGLSGHDAKTLLLDSDGKTILFDDGAGSHNGNLFKSFSLLDDIYDLNKVEHSVADGWKSRAKVLARPFLQKQLGFNVKEIALFNPSKSEESAFKDVPVSTIERPDDSSALHYVLCPDSASDDYKGFSIVYLTLPNQGGVDAAVLDAELDLIRELIEEFGNAVAVRPHPRRSVSSLYEFKDHLVSAIDSWEVLLFEGAIRESTILLAYGSTALESPKRLCGLEPPVIFLNRLLPKQEPLYSSAEQSRVGMQRTYVKTHDITAPTTVTALIDQIRSYFEKNDITQ